MMYKKVFFWSITAGILSTISCIIYNRIYFFATEVDFSKVLNTLTLTGINLIACLVAGAGYWLLIKWLKVKGEIIFNFAFSILSFASVIIPFWATLPLNIESPELFPGLAVPMHFFPALAWFTLQPLFRIDKTA